MIKTLTNPVFFFILLVNSPSFILRRALKKNQLIFFEFSVCVIGFFVFFMNRKNSDQQLSF